MRAGPGAQYGSLFVKNRAPDARSRGSLAGAMDERAVCPPPRGWKFTSRGVRGPQAGFKTYILETKHRMRHHE